ncbi:hypothetical protein GN956_G22685 [Arapaima gigas]
MQNCHGAKRCYLHDLIFPLEFLTWLGVAGNSLAATNQDLREHRQPSGFLSRSEAGIVPSVFKFPATKPVCGKSIPVRDGAEKPQPPSQITSRNFEPSTINLSSTCVCCSAMCCLVHHAPPLVRESAGGISAGQRGEDAGSSLSLDHH